MRAPPALRIMGRGLSRFGNKPIAATRRDSIVIAIFLGHSTPFADNTIIVPSHDRALSRGMIVWRVW